MPQIDYDLIVLGGGSGGLTVASGALEEKYRTPGKQQKNSVCSWMEMLILNG